MSREIKFRGKRKDNGEWVYGNLINWHPTMNPRIVWREEVGETVQELDFQETNNEVVPETVGQLWSPSEGLELYSGDLILAICSPSGSNTKKERICKVDFDGRGMSVSVWYKKEWWAYGSMNFTTAKVIGNVFENPELLQK